MPAGLQCWDASGNLILDLTDSLTRVVAVLNIAANASGTYQLPAGRPFWFSCNNQMPNVAASAYAPAVSVNGSNLLSYGPGAAMTGAAVDSTLLVGVY